MHSLAVHPLFDTVFAYIKQETLFKPSDHLLLSFSGGPDSLFLLAFLKATHKGPITALYFNHGLRPNDESSDTKQLQAIKTKLDISLIEKKIPVTLFSKRHGVSIEHAGRILRQGLLCHMAKIKKCQAILTGHHADDLLETYLLQQQRGNALPCGLFSKKIIHGHVFAKPLLCLKKTDMIQALNKLNLPYISDASNNLPIYERNKIRLQLSQHSTKKKQQVEAVIVEAIKKNKTTVATLKKATTPALLAVQKNKHPRLPVHELLRLNQEEQLFLLDAVCHHWYQHFTKKTHGSKKIMPPYPTHTSHHLRKIVEAIHQIQSKSTSKIQLDIPGHIRIACTPSYIEPEFKKHAGKHWEPESKQKQAPKIYLSIRCTPHFFKALPKSFWLIENKLKLTITKLTSSDNNHSSLDFTDKNNQYIDCPLNTTLTIRTKKTGDAMTLFTHHEKTMTQSVKKIMINHKIDATKKSQIPLFFIENTLVWVGGIQRSNEFKIPSPSNEARNNIGRIKLKLTEYNE